MSQSMAGVLTSQAAAVYTFPSNEVISLTALPPAQERATVCFSRKGWKLFLEHHSEGPHTPH